MTTTTDTTALDMATREEEIAALVAAEILEFVSSWGAEIPHRVWAAAAERRADAHHAIRDRASWGYWMACSAPGRRVAEYLAGLESR